MDRLEIIGPNGNITFYDLPVKGVTNIGRHSENDVVLDSPDIAPFHAMLDHRQRPYQIMLLAAEGIIRVGAEPLLPNISKALHNRANIQVDHFTIVLVEDDGQHPPAPGPGVGLPGAVQPAAPLPSTPAKFPPPTTRPERPAASYRQAFTPTLPPPSPGVMAPTPQSAYVNAMPLPQPMAPMNGPPADQKDDVIIAKLAENEWTVEVDQTVSAQLTITNGGHLVAAFMITIQGLDESWVRISQPYINLNEGERATIIINISPPRLPTSFAGPHHFAVTVTSSDYPNRMSRCGATLFINPYYEFMVGELAPRRQTISWFKHFGKVTVPITNLGNNKTPFHLAGKDDEQACSFEFDVPGEMVPLATQAEMRLQPEESISIPIQITPHSRRLVGFRRRRYSYTVTANLTEGQQTPRSMLGELGHKPLIGPLVFLLMGLLFVMLCLILLEPDLNTFKFNDLAYNQTRREIQNGTPVAIHWEAPFYTTDRQIEPPIEGLDASIARVGTVVVYPRTNTRYIFTGGNILSRFAGPIFPTPFMLLDVKVTSIPPAVTFEAQPDQVVNDGKEEVVLSWSVENADHIILSRKVGEALEEIDDFSEHPVHSLRVTPDPNAENTIYILEASNAYVPTPTPYSQRVAVLTPSPTIPPTPGIVLFNANPQIINEGEKSVLSWVVNGVQEVTIQGVDNANALPAEHQLEVQPTGSTQYFLTIPGVPPRPAQVTVIPATATPTSTPEPTAPQITFFTADPIEVVKGDINIVELKWIVVGATTNIEISGPTLANPVSNLQNEGSFKTTLEDTALFILTAFNGTAKTSESLQIDSIEPTPTPSPAPTLPPAPNIVNFEAFAANANAQITYLPGSSGATNNTYQVVAGSKIQLKWIVQNDPTDVTLIGPSSTFPGRAPTESNFSAPSLDPVISSGTYRLTAKNDGGSATDYTVEIQVVPQDPPPAPFNFAYDSGRFDWDYDANHFEDIIGFRLYRTAAGEPVSPVLVVDEITLKVTKDSNGQVTDVVRDLTIDFADPPIKFKCHDVYYLVAVYKDIADLRKKETNAAADSLYVGPCP